MFTLSRLPLRPLCRCNLVVEVNSLLKIPSDPVVSEGWSLVRDRTSRKHCPSHKIWSYKRDGG